MEVLIEGMGVFSQVQEAASVGTRGESRSLSGATLEQPTAQGGVKTFSLPAGISIKVEEGMAVARLQSPASAAGAPANANGAAVSTTVSVVLLRSGQVFGPASSVAMTEVNGELIVSNIDGSAGVAASLPGATQQSVNFVMRDESGVSVRIAILVTEGGIILQPAGDTAESSVNTMREPMIAMAVLEVRRQLNVALEKIRSIYLELK